MTNWLQHLTFSKLAFTIEATQPLMLPPYKGSTFRGAFGNQFKSVVCINRNGDCESCILAKNCSYYYIFETPNLKNFSWFSSPKLPHPFVIEPPLTSRENFKVGEKLCFYLILIGKAIDYLPYFIFVFENIGRTAGLGRKRRENYGRFKLCCVEDELNNKKIIYDGKEKVLRGDLNIQKGDDWNNELEEEISDYLTLRFITPTRLKHNGKYLFLHKNKDFPVDAFLGNIYRRGFLLTHSHCINETESFQIPDFSSLELKEMDLEWYDWERYSTRQEQKQQYGGFVGQITLKGDIAKWLQILNMGEVLHVGSGTAFGLGQYILSK